MSTPHAMKMYSVAAWSSLTTSTALPLATSGCATGGGVGDLEGPFVGGVVGDDGDSVGRIEGFAVGRKVGRFDGGAVGFDGDSVGEGVGDGVGSLVGLNVGLSVGDGVGDGVGSTVGDGVGRSVGPRDGGVVGFGVGFAKGTMLLPSLQLPEHERLVAKGAVTVVSSQELEPHCRLHAPVPQLMTVLPLHAFWPEQLTVTSVAEKPLMTVLPSHDDSP